MSGSAAAGLALAKKKKTTPADPSPISMLTMLVFITRDTCFVAVLKIIGPTAEAEMRFFFFFFTRVGCLITLLSPQIRVCLHAIMTSVSYRREIRKRDGSG